MGSDVSPVAASLITEDNVRYWRQTRSSVARFSGGYLLGSLAVGERDENFCTLFFKGVFIGQIAVDETGKKLCSPFFGGVFIGQPCSR